MGTLHIVLYTQDFDCVLDHLQVPDPEFEGQTKTRLGNPEVRKIVEGIVSQVRHGSYLLIDPGMLQRANCWHAAHRLQQALQT